MSLRMRLGSVRSRVMSVSLNCPRPNANTSGLASASERWLRCDHIRTWFKNLPIRRSQFQTYKNKITFKDIEEFDQRFIADFGQINFEAFEFDSWAISASASLEIQLNLT